MHQRKECLLNKQTRKIEPVVLDSMLLLANEAQNLKKLYDVLMVQSILAIGCGSCLINVRRPSATGTQERIHLSLHGVHFLHG